MEPPFSLLRRQLPSGEAKCGTKMVSIILCAPTVGCATSLCPPQTPNSSLLTSKAIPHNSKCRYGERGAADAKPKAGCFIEHFGNADAVPQPPERCLSRKAGIVRCCLKAKSRRNPLWIPRLFNAKSGCVCRNRRYFRLFRYTLAQRRNFPSFRSYIRINSSIIHKYSKSMYKY